MDESIRKNAKQVLKINNRMEFGGQISGIQFTIIQLLDVTKHLETQLAEREREVGELRAKNETLTTERAALWDQFNHDDAVEIIEEFIAALEETP